MEEHVPAPSGGTAPSGGWSVNDLSKTSVCMHMGPEVAQCDFLSRSEIEKSSK